MVSERAGARRATEATRISITRRLLMAAALAGMLTSAGWALDRVYTGDLLLRLAAGAALGAVAVSLLAARLPAWTVAPLSILALAGYALLATRLSAAAGGIPGPPTRLAVDALRDAVPRLLSALVPVEPQPDTVLVPVLATWLAGLAAAELAMRAGRGLAGCAPPIALFAAALVLVGPHAAATAGPTLVLAGGAAIVLAAAERTWSGGGGPARRAHAGHAAGAALAALVAVVALGAAAGPLVAARIDRSPADPRREVVPPRLDALDENPLARLSGWALTPDRHMFDADLTAAAGPVRIRLAVCADYDGVTWRVGATYRSAGRVLPDPPRPGDGVSRRRLRHRITIAELDGRLVPAAATPRRIDGVRVAYDPGSGTVALPEGLRPGMTYAVQSDLSTVDINVLPELDVPAGPAVARFLELGSAVPPELTRLANQLGEGSAAPYERALAIEQFLAEHYQLVADAPSGHAYPNLAFFLFGPRHGGAQRGTTEQFAASFAVLGRILGLPTRVALGFTARPGSPAVRAADAFAWPEVLFEGVGWVPFNPLPQSDSVPRPVEEDFKPSPPPSAPPPSSVPPPSVSATPPATPPTTPSAAPAAAPADRTPLLLAVATATAALAGAYLIVVPAVRRRMRRARLTHGSAAQRVAGAWREVLDGLRLAGRAAPADLVVTEVAAHAARAAGTPGDAATGPWIRPGVPPPIGPAPPLDDLARLANAAAFGPDPPDTGQADHAARLALSYVDTLRARQPWLRRLRWTLDPRPVWWARR